MSEKVIYKGEDRSVKVQLLDTNGLAYPVTGATITAQLKDMKKSQTSNGAVVTCASNETGAVFAAGTVVVPWTDTETAALTVGKYNLELNIVLSGGDIKKAIAGPFCVEDSVI